MYEIDTPQFPAGDLNGNSLRELRINAVRAVLGAQAPDAGSEGTVQDNRRLAMVRAEWLAVAAELGLPVSDVRAWMTDDGVLQRLVDAFDMRSALHRHGVFIVR